LACDYIREVEFLTQVYSSEVGGTRLLHEEEKQYSRHVIALANTNCVINEGFEFLQRELEFEVFVQTTMTSTRPSGAPKRNRRAKRSSWFAVSKALMMHRRGACVPDGAAGRYGYQIGRQSSFTRRLAELFVKTIRFDDGRQPVLDDAAHETSNEVLENDASIILEFRRIAFTLV
jgi:hypothetical protein